MELLLGLHLKSRQGWNLPKRSSLYDFILIVVNARAYLSGAPFRTSSKEWARLEPTDEELLLGLHLNSRQGWSLPKWSSF